MKSLARPRDQGHAVISSLRSWRPNSRHFRIIAFHFGRMSVAREFLMCRRMVLIMLGCMFCTGLAFGDDAAPPKPDAASPAGPGAQAGGDQAATSGSPKTEEAKLLLAVREAMERNAQEIKALKEQYAKDMEEQQKKADAQQAQIETLQRTARLLEERLKAKGPTPDVPGGQVAPGGPNGQAQDRQQKLSDIQQKQLKVLEEQLGLVADEVEKQSPGGREIADPDRHAGVASEAGRPAGPAARRRPRRLAG